MSAQVATTNHLDYKSLAPAQYKQKWKQLQEQAKKEKISVNELITRINDLTSENTML